MTADDVLEVATKSGLSISVDDGNLAVRPRERLTDDLRAMLVQHKAEIVGLLRQREQPMSACADCRHRSAFGNCGVPILAGLTTRFELVKHPVGGAVCRAYQRVETAQQADLRRRAESLRGRFYPDDDMTLLRQLIDAGDDLAGLETLIADAESQVGKARAQNP